MAAPGKVISDVKVWVSRQTERTILIPQVFAIKLLTKNFVVSRTGFRQEYAYHVEVENGSCRFYILGGQRVSGDRPGSPDVDPISRST